MVAMGFTQTDTVLGKLTNGRKLVLTVVTVADNELEAATVTVKPLKRIIGWTLGLGTPITSTFVCASHGTILNQITIDPNDIGAIGCILQILSVGE
jgi:hypothetical protein